MSKRKSLIPYHFGTKLDIIPNRTGNWYVIDEWSMANKLLELKSSTPDIVVSGDCMAAIGAHREGMPLVWFDAHGDFHTLETSQTCNAGGMVLAMMAGLGDQSLMVKCDLKPIDTKKIVHVGGSEFDRLEETYLMRAGVSTKDKLDKYLLKDLENIHLHIDTDVVSSMDVGSAFHPAPKGIRSSVFWEQMELLLPRTKVLSIKSYDPRKDHDGIGEALVLELIRRFE